jgi:O-antigen/teichoic acid export membrane protein
MSVAPPDPVAEGSTWLPVSPVTAPPATTQRQAIEHARQSASGAWSRWRGRIGKFFAGQLAVQLLAFVTGLLVLRWMSEAEYAKTGVVLGFQAMFAAFVDLGVGGSLVALIGSRGGDRRVVGGYVAAARWWRGALLAVVVPLGAVAFFIVNLRQGWSLQESAALYLCIAVSLYFAGVTAWASAPLLIHQRLGTLYAVSNAGSVARLAGCWLLHESGQLDAISLTVLGTLVSAGSAGLYARAAQRHVQEPPRSDASTRLEIRRYVAPLVPLAIFYAVQGQLATFLVAWFGQAQNIAEVTALGRLGQLFAFLSALFGMLVMPYFARIGDAVFVHRYTWAVLATLGTAGLISAAAFAFPHPLLWLLGPRYDHLLHAVGWVVLAGALGFAGGAIWTIHAARQWVFWRGTALYIAASVLAQAVFIAMVDMGSTLNAVLLGVVASGAALIAQVPIAGMGLRRDRLRLTRQGLGA